MLTSKPTPKTWFFKNFVLLAIDPTLTPEKVATSLHKLNIEEKILHHEAAAACWIHAYNCFSYLPEFTEHVKLPWITNTALTSVNGKTR